MTQTGLNKVDIRLSRVFKWDSGALTWREARRTTGNRYRIWDKTRHADGRISTNNPSDIEGGSIHGEEALLDNLQRYNKLWSDHGYTEGPVNPYNIT